MSHYSSPPPSTDRVRRSPRPRSSLRVRNVAAGVIYHLVFEGNVQRLSGKQLRQHLARISRVPAAEQQLFVHGQSFAANATGASVGLQDDDIVDLVQAAEDGVISSSTRSGMAPATARSMGATASSLRPSTDAGTLSPEVPRGPSHFLDGDDDARRRRHGGAMQSSASMVSTATASTRRAPTPERLVGSEDGGGARAAPAAAAAPGPAVTSAHDPRPHAVLNDSGNMPLWTSATTLSSHPSNLWPAGEGVSPPPQRPAPAMRPSAAAAHPSQPGADRMRPSYEVASPPPPAPLVAHHHNAYYYPPPPPPQPHHGAPAQHYGHAGNAYDVLDADRSSARAPRAAAQPAVAGLNHSYYPPSGAAPDRPRSSMGRQRPPASHHQSSRGPSTMPSGYSPNAAYGGDARDLAVNTPDVVISADELETLLDEQNYVWQMEAYRFRTERQNRLTALQHRQRELTFEAARYDQAVADVARQLARERGRLAELQQAMTHNATTSTPTVPSPWHRTPAEADAFSNAAYGGAQDVYGYAHMAQPPMGAAAEGEVGGVEEEVLVDGY